MQKKCLYKLDLNEEQIRSLRISHCANPALSWLTVKNSAASARRLLYRSMPFDLVIREGSGWKRFVMRDRGGAP